jgi:hypothetical protein
MYDISKRTYTVARRYGLVVVPSTRKNKKLDVYKNNQFLASIGDSRYKDRHMYLKQDGKAIADERTRLYYLRHKQDTLKENLSKILLW